MPDTSFDQEADDNQILPMMGSHTDLIQIKMGCYKLYWRLSVFLSHVLQLCLLATFIELHFLWSVVLGKVSIYFLVQYRNNSITLLLLLLLLLLNRFSCFRLCATPQMAAHQAPLSLGFSRQEHWSGLSFPSPMHESEK